ncbi:MAG: hypothetical protein AAGC96_01455 [Pseudomonadota bacterium]
MFSNICRIASDIQWWLVHGSRAQKIVSVCKKVDLIRPAQAKTLLALANKDLTEFVPPLIAWIAVLNAEKMPPQV